MLRQLLSYIRHLLKPASVLLQDGPILTRRKQQAPHENEPPHLLRNTDQPYHP